MGLFGSRGKGRGDAAEPHSAEAHGTNKAGEASPIKDYDKFDSKQLMPRLHGCTQAELTALDEYERSHQNRVEVLNKLRYMRGAEPMEGYDEMTPDEIITELQSADMPTIKAVRAYERKFANRSKVVDYVTQIHGERLAGQPKEPVPAYQAGGGSHDKIKHPPAS